MKINYLNPSMTSMNKIENYCACQYFTDFVSPSYSGLLETFTGTCPNPSFSEQINVTFQPDPSDPHKGFLILVGFQNNFPITLLDSEGHFKSHFDISSPTPFGNQCIAQPQSIDISGQVTPESVTFHIDHAFFNMTNAPGETCILLGQTCNVPSEFNGTAT